MLFHPSIKFFLCLYNDFHLHIVVSGAANFGTRDGYPFDRLSVEVEGNKVIGLNIHDVANGVGASGWQEWGWTAPNDGNVNVRLTVGGDGEGWSYGLFDGIAIPEGWPAGGNVATFGLCLLAIEILRRTSSLRYRKEV